MGRDTLKAMFHSYYWGRMDQRNWTDYDDERLIDLVLHAYQSQRNQLEQEERDK